MEVPGMRHGTVSRHAGPGPGLLTCALAGAVARKRPRRASSEAKAVVGRWTALTNRLGTVICGDWRDIFTRPLLLVLHPLEYPCTSRMCTRCSRFFFLFKVRAWPLVNRFVPCQCGGRARRPTDEELYRMILLL